MSRRKKKPRNRGPQLPSCVGCGGQGFVRRGALPICKLCIHLTPEQWQDAQVEMRRVNTRTA